MYLCGIISQDGVVDGGMAARSPRILENGRTFSYLVHDGQQRITVTAGSAIPFWNAASSILCSFDR